MRLYTRPKIKDCVQIVKNNDLYTIKSGVPFDFLTDSFKYTIHQSLAEPQGSSLSRAWSVAPHFSTFLCGLRSSAF